MRRWYINLPDQDLAYFPEGTEHFKDYVMAVEWAQQFALVNRQIMMANVVTAARTVIAKPFNAEVEAVKCHPKYVTREHHYRETSYVVSATKRASTAAPMAPVG